MGMCPDSAEEDIVVVFVCKLLKERFFGGAGFAPKKKVNDVCPTPQTNNTRNRHPALGRGKTPRMAYETGK